MLIFAYLFLSCLQHWSHLLLIFLHEERMNRIIHSIHYPTSSCQVKDFALERAIWLQIFWHRAAITVYTGSTSHHPSIKSSICCERQHIIGSAPHPVSPSLSFLLVERTFYNSLEKERCLRRTLDVSFFESKMWKSKAPEARSILNGSWKTSGKGSHETRTRPLSATRRDFRRSYIR
jgi:hypothetical protein